MKRPIAAAAKSATVGLRRWLVLLIAVLGCPFALISQSAPAQNDRPDTLTARWEARLTALHPDQPREYFLLAEDVTEAATTPREHELARRLFALAGLLDRATFGASAALALADLEPDETARRRLRALAALLADASQRSLPSYAAPPATLRTWQPPTAVLLCDVFSQFRQGQGARALSRLRSGSTRELLERVVGNALPVGDGRTFDDTLRQYRTQRPPLTWDQRLTFLRLERALLRGEARSWADEITLSQEKPLIEVDPERPEEVFGFTAEEPVYRDGRWTRPDSETARRTTTDTSTAALPPRVSHTYRSGRRGVVGVFELPPNELLQITDEIGVLNRPDAPVCVEGLLGQFQAIPHCSLERFALQIFGEFPIQRHCQLQIVR